MTANDLLAEAMEGWKICVADLHKAADICWETEKRMNRMKKTLYDILEIIRSKKEHLSETINEIEKLVLDALEDTKGKDHFA